MQRKARRPVLAVVIMVLLAFAGCSDDDGGGTVAAVTTTGVPTPTTASTTPTGSVNCANQGFTPNSDDVAGGIVATGLPCAEAEAFVRTVGPMVGAVGGPANIEVGGFKCVRTAQDDGAYGLPSSDYECTRGTAKITFHRT